MCLRARVHRDSCERNFVRGVDGQIKICIAVAGTVIEDVISTPLRHGMKSDMCKKIKMNVPLCVQLFAGFELKHAPRTLVRMCF